MILKNPLDSHAHWLATGEVASSLRLTTLTRPSDLKNIKIKNEYYRGEFLIGSGWDQNNFIEKKFSENKMPTRQDLDEIFPDIPVALWRIDGHAMWLNTLALKLIGVFDSQPQIEGGEFMLDSNKVPTGILVDLACKFVEQKIPSHNKVAIASFLKKSCEVFNQNGFTHIRDLTCDEAQWNAALEIDQKNELTLEVDQYFSAFDPHNFETQLDLAKKAKQETTNSLCVKGIKVWYDGALGSEGAFLSADYLTRAEYRGLALIPKKRLSEIMEQTWSANLDLAVHVIGDQAATDVVDVAVDLFEKNIKGKLHLEHAQLLQPQSILKMKTLDVECHMQPSHWLSDKKWLEKKIGPLIKTAFLWDLLESHEIKFDFGSDSPVENPSLFRTIEAILDAEQNGIEATRQHPLIYHQCDSARTKDCYTEILDGHISKTVFNGKVVYSRS